MATGLELKNTNKQWLALWFECSSGIADLQVLYPLFHLSFKIVSQLHKSLLRKA
jgi:hypothetical protein